MWILAYDEVHTMKYITKKDCVFPKRSRASHKGENGIVLIVGGSEEYPGAVMLASLAALRAGADLGIAAAPSRVAWCVNSRIPDAITIKLPGKHLSMSHASKILKTAERADCVLLGNGAGLHAHTKKLFQHLVRRLKKPLVIDADALKSIRIQDVHNAILTPNKKELEILLQNSKLNDFKRYLRDNVIIIKGAIDTICTSGGMFYNKTGNPGMTRGGTGDVLAGLCAGFVAQKLSLKDAAVTATYINGLTGDILEKRHKGYSYLAYDLAEDVREVMRALRKKSR